MTPVYEKRIKVLFLTKWYPHAGDPQLGIFVKKHAQAAALFDDVALLYISPLNPQLHVTGFYIQDEQQVRQLFFYYRKTRLEWLNAWRYFLTIRRARKSILKNFGKPDIIHANLLARTGLIAWYLSVKFRVPYLITEHWTGFVNGKFRRKPGWYQWLTHQVVKRAVLLTVVSEGLKHSMKELGFTCNMMVLPNVVDLPELITANHHQRIRFLTVADLLDEQKNISSTIRVVARLAKERQDIEFHIVGGGPDEQSLKKLAQEYGILNTFVFFHGRRSNDEVYEHIQQSCFVVVNSNTETFSVVTAEALACGKPIVATISGGPEEIISSETGLLIEKGNEAELERALRTMLETYRNYDPRLLRKSVENRFSRKEIGQQLHRIYIRHSAGVQDDRYPIR